VNGEEILCVFTAKCGLKRQASVGYNKGTAEQEKQSCSLVQIEISESY